MPWREKSMVIASIIIILSTNLSVTASWGSNFIKLADGHICPLFKNKNNNQTNPWEDNYFLNASIAPAAFTEIQT
ncbi:hypothetical protein [[Eubacterium] cellulosolvens]